MTLYTMQAVDRASQGMFVYKIKLSIVNCNQIQCDPQKVGYINGVMKSKTVIKNSKNCEPFHYWHFVNKFIIYEWLLLKGRHGDASTYKLYQPNHQIMAFNIADITVLIGTITFYDIYLNLL